MKDKPRLVAPVRDIHCDHGVVLGYLAAEHPSGDLERQQYRFDVHVVGNVDRGRYRQAGGRGLLQSLQRRLRRGIGLGGALPAEKWRK
jgi:hypothetical protein